MAEYLERMEGSGDAEAGGEIPTEEERLAETVMLTLRRVQDGIPVGGLGRDPDFAARLDRLVSADLLERVGDRARLTRRGLMVADAVVVELVRS
jgi:coproporphyrinogen III oxidase-like Fe-S oxidoreductase